MAAAAASVGKEGDDKHGDGRWMMMVSYISIFELEF